MHSKTRIYFELIKAQVRHPFTKVEYVWFENGVVVKKVQLPFRKF